MPSLHYLWTSVKQYSGLMSKVLLIFIGITLITASIVTIFANWKVGLAFGSLLGLFTSVHIGRSLASETFEINATNKDKKKGLSWYENEIISHMHDLRYELMVNEKGLKIWQPSPRARIMGGEFKMEVTPYSITISGSRGTVRIMQSILDINKIFI